MGLGESAGADDCYDFRGLGPKDTHRQGRNARSPKCGQVGTIHDTADVARCAIAQYHQSIRSSDSMVGVQDVTVNHFHPRGIVRVAYVSRHSKASEVPATMAPTQVSLSW